MLCPSFIVIRFINDINLLYIKSRSNMRNSTMTRYQKSLIQYYFSKLKNLNSLSVDFLVIKIFQTFFKQNWFFIPVVITTFLLVLACNVPKN